MQNSAQILQRNLQVVLDSVTDNAELFSRIAVHPSPNYPGRTQENVLGQLLRKKLEPDVADLVEEGREAAALATPEGIAALQDVWNELREWTVDRIATYVREEAGDVYTKEERDLGVENVRTGLKRDLEESDEEDEDGDEDEDEDENGQDAMVTDSANGTAQSGQARAKQETVSRGPEPETILWFAARGDFDVPPQVEYQRKDGVYRGLQGVSVPSESLGGAGTS
jgi:mediator of RNA polymerase II transcription subunit 8